MPAWPLVVVVMVVVVAVVRALADCLHTYTSRNPRFSKLFGLPSVRLDVWHVALNMLPFACCPYPR